MVLEKRDVNITTQFMRIFKIFVDFRFICQLSKDMDKMKPIVIPVHQ